MILNSLSIIIPCYNEKETIEKIISEVINADIGKIKKEIIIKDDGSKDGTRNILKSLLKKHSEIIVILQH